jgi:nicotinamidase/pyrazinamidase
VKALLLVDIQNDFLPGGALAVPDGDRVVPVANRLIPQFELVVATKDWHPVNHGSFATQHPGREAGETIQLNGLDQILWPDHCVQNTRGADLASALDADHIDEVLLKGIDAGIDSYSGFFDNGRRKSTGLADFLHGRNVTGLYVMGLATDFCVKFTVMDALDLGFRVYLIEDGCRGVNLRPDDTARAVDEMRTAGARVVQSDRPLYPER